MKLGGYALEDLESKLRENFAQGLAEFKRLLKRYADDKEAKEIVQRLDKAGKKERAKILEELKALADSRKLEESGGSGSLPTGDYRRAERTAGTR